MDTELLRTFLEVEKTRHFAKAAQNIFVTQAAVSARISQLESMVGQRLFTRERNNIQLTVAGNRLVPYAESIIAAWSRALTETAFGDEQRSLVVLGCLPSLREIYLDKWLTELSVKPRSWLLQVESLNTLQLVSLLREGAIGMGIVYEPPRAPDLWVEQLTSFDLILVSTTPERHLEQGLPGYVYVDWGSSFTVTHRNLVADMVAPQIKVDTPVLAHSLLMQNGGSAFLASPMIRQDLGAGKLFTVQGAPTITRSVYLIGRNDTEKNEAFTEVGQAFHRLANQ
jgi:DNA-binding transcriptional LysR family regulator